MISLFELELKNVLFGVIAMGVEVFIVSGGVMEPNPYDLISFYYVVAATLVLALTMVMTPFGGLYFGTGITRLQPFDTAEMGDTKDDEPKEEKEEEVESVDDW